MKEARKLDVVLHSATGLKSASKMSVHVVAWIEPSVRVPSPVTKAHGTHPVFDTTISMVIDDKTLGRGMHLNVELLGQGLVSTRRIGFVRILLSDILQEGSNGAAVHMEFHAHPVTRRSGRQKGFLSFDIYLHATSDAKGGEEMTTPKPHPIGRSLTVTPLSKTQGASMQQRFEVEGDQSDDMVSPSSCSEDGYYNRMSSRKRLYALRPKSFNFNGLLSCY
ncbi:hypothetical protein KC19_10G176200 [Ceratodon purpureus]|uniref:C2 domain-containing protein n=1 Tax=Ceratodon purpureus TaxID=3225 RepID=A0A8T0GPG7_CERPU|nr:hypothetical protein KC19_10G176200 [Ceratodon purpureus]